MYKKTITIAIMLLVGAIALSAMFGDASEAAAEATLQNEAQTATVEVTDKGFEPASLKLKAGVPAKVTFVRKTDATRVCDSISGSILLSLFIGCGRSDGSTQHPVSSV